MDDDDECIAPLSEMKSSHWWFASQQIYIENQNGEQNVTYNIFNSNLIFFWKQKTLLGVKWKLEVNINRVGIIERCLTEMKLMQLTFWC